MPPFLRTSTRELLLLKPLLFRQDSFRFASSHWTSSSSSSSNKKKNTKMGDRVPCSGKPGRSSSARGRGSVKIVQICRELGIGEGGFYRPGYREGAKLHLQMMCLGKDWDPESRLYNDRRQYDGAIPQKIPDYFKNLVEKGLHKSHDFLKRKNISSYIEELPGMSPDICIVNFYSDSGKLGLHQDRDESVESLRKGLPVVSFSVGDSAWFSYGDGRDVDKADKVLLESGDVLIFGGKSRLIFHGVDSIEPKTAPSKLVEETKLKPGRLNLTFRQQ